MLPKSWFIDENHRRLLIKGTYEFSNQEPINEYLATQIAKRLNMSHCPYEVRTWQGKLVSVCENFLKGDQEIITANDIYDLRKKKNHVSDYEHYLEILAAHGLADARNELENMLVLDFLMMNHDRHMKNFGIIRNVKTLEWEKVAPIYDTGQAMNCDKLTKEMNFFEGCGKLFFNTKKKFSTYPKLIHDWSRFDFEKLADLPEEYEAILRQYQVYTQMPDSRIEKQVAGLKWRIANLKSYSQ
nr:HipA domain-containing protein [Enterococcus cecorum]